MSRKKKTIVKGFIHSWKARKLDLALSSNWIFAQKCPNKFWKKQNILKCHKVTKSGKKVKVFFYFLSQRCKSHFNLTTFFKWKIKVLLLRSFSLKYFFLDFNSIWRFFFRFKNSKSYFRAVLLKNDFSFNLTI